MAVKGIQDVLQVEPEVVFPGEVDRVYRQVPGKVAVGELNRRMVIGTTGFPDVVVWNPGPELCATLKDMDPEGYRRMLCVEAAVASFPAEVPAGATWQGSQELLAQ